MTDTLERREAIRLKAREALCHLTAAANGNPEYAKAAGELRDAVSDGLDLALTTSPRVEEGRARYRHKKRGTFYEVLGVAELQAEQPQVEKAALTIYRGDDGKLWARNTAEFYDGRFEQVALATTPADPRVGKIEADLEAAKKALARFDEARAPLPHPKENDRG